MTMKKNLVEILISFGIILLLLYSSEPVLYPDSPRYLNQSLLDPPLYSTLIKIMQSLFGNLKSVVVIQTLLIGISINFFIKTLSKKFNLNILSKIIIFIFLFLPILQFYRNILTESIGYAFSLLLVSFTVKLIFSFSIQNLIWITFLVIALLLTRNQFIFIYPVILILYTGIFILKKSKKTFTFLVASFLSILIIHNSINYLNINLKRDALGYKSNANIKLGPYHFTYFDAIYISSSEDIFLFENEDIRKTLSSIFDEMNNRKALLKYYNSRGHFSLSLNEISDYSQNLIEELAKKQKKEISDLKKEISFKLINKNFGKYIKHIFKKFYDSTWLFIFLPFFILLAALINFLKFKSHLSLLMIFLSSFAFLNHSIVYMFGRVQPRYLIYTDFILLIFIFVLFNIFLNKKTKR